MLPNRPRKPSCLANRIPISLQVRRNNTKGSRAIPQNARRTTIIPATRILAGNHLGWILIGRIANNGTTVNNK
jgi:hypothetical protein